MYAGYVCQWLMTATLNFRLLPEGEVHELSLSSIIYVVYVCVVYVLK